MGDRPWAYNTYYTSLTLKTSLAVRLVASYVVPIALPHHTKRGELGAGLLSLNTYRQAGLRSLIVLDSSLR